LVIGGSLLDLGQTKLKDLGDVGVGLCTRLDEGGFIRLGKFLPFIGLDLPTFVKVVLRPNDNTWYIGDTTKVDDLVVDNLDHVERVAGADRVYKNVAMNADSMLGVQDGEFVLTGGVDDFAFVFSILE